MEEFTKNIDDDKFRSTNGFWNELRLNNPWSVGYVSNLIQQQEFSSKEEWENFYDDSGKERNQKIAQLPVNEQKMLNDFQLPKAEIGTLTRDKQQLNFNWGRTNEQLLNKAIFLLDAIKKQGNRFNLNIEDCIECVKFRTICETWNGIIIREKNTIKTLKTLFPKIEFKNVLGEIDYEYGIDYELYLHENLLGAIQIKPNSYLGDASYLQKAKYANEQKHQKYKEKFKKNAVFVISKSNGEVLNQDFVERLTKYYKENT